MLIQDDDAPRTRSQPAALPLDHENYNKWFYRDPQGDLQGKYSPCLNNEHT